MRTSEKAQGQRLREGAALATMMTPIRTLPEVARILKVTPTRVSQIEYLALWKVRQRMRDFSKKTY